MKHSTLGAVVILSLAGLSSIGLGKYVAYAQAQSAQPSPSAEAYKQANMKMHTGMNVEFTGDADVDFVNGMIPHHEGAVDMAKIVIKFGKDPELRKLAEDIIKAQDTEIAFMKKWRENKVKNPVKQP
jgi:uncharacterized protein (DUF305 family)